MTDNGPLALRPTSPDAQYFMRSSASSRSYIIRTQDSFSRSLTGLHHSISSCFSLTLHYSGARPIISTGFTSSTVTTYFYIFTPHPTGSCTHVVGCPPLLPLPPPPVDLQMVTVPPPPPPGPPPPLAPHTYVSRDFLSFCPLSWGTHRAEMSGDAKGPLRIQLYSLHHRQGSAPSLVGSRSRPTHSFFLPFHVDQVWLEDADRMNKDFFTAHRERPPGTTLQTLCDAQGSLQTHPDVILDMTADYFERIFTADVCTPEVLLAREQIWQHTRPRCIDAMAEILLAPFTDTELRDAIESLDPSSCPG